MNISNGAISGGLNTAYETISDHNLALFYGEGCRKVKNLSTWQSQQNRIMEYFYVLFSDGMEQKLFTCKYGIKRARLLANRHQRRII